MIYNTDNKFLHALKHLLSITSIVLGLSYGEVGGLLKETTTALQDSFMDSDSAASLNFNSILQAGLNNV